MSCGVGHRWGRNPVWLWRRPLSWELPYAEGMALRTKKTKKTRALSVAQQVKDLALSLQGLGSLLGRGFHPCWPHPHPHPPMLQTSFPSACIHPPCSFLMVCHFSEYGLSVEELPPHRLLSGLLDTAAAHAQRMHRNPGSGIAGPGLLVQLPGCCPTRAGGQCSAG